jgi:hypothetical protein
MTRHQFVPSVMYTIPFYISCCKSTWHWIVPCVMSLLLFCISYDECQTIHHHVMLHVILGDTHRNIPVIVAFIDSIGVLFSCLSHFIFNILTYHWPIYSLFYCESLTQYLLVSFTILKTVRPRCSLTYVQYYLNLNWV